MENQHQQIMEIANHLWLQGMMPAGDGNISARVEVEKYLITASRVSKGFLQPNQVLFIDSSGKVLGGDGDVSSEVALHLKAYCIRGDINAIIHAHPPYASAFACTGKELPIDLLSEVIVKLGKKIPIAPFALPSSEQTAEIAEPFIREFNGFLLKNHGAVTLGRTLEEAFLRMELIEHLAKVTILSKMLGKYEQISSEAMFALEAMAEKW